MFSRGEGLSSKERGILSDKEMLREVFIDGVRYVPESSGAPLFATPKEQLKIGVSITTHDRPDFLAKTIQEMEDKLPEGAVKVVVDDEPAKPVSVPEGWILHRFDVNRGTPVAKN